MTRNSEFRDYLHVSARKISRMSRTLRPDAWKRVWDIQLTLGPVGATLKLDSDSRAEDVIALVPEVERAIDDEHGIKYLTDSRLKVGHWFMIDGVPMKYGVPGDAGGVLFVGEEGVRFVLCGSAAYLLDREVADHPYGYWGHSASRLRGLRRLLALAARRELDDELPFLDYAGPNDYYFESVSTVLDSGIEPLAAVARCLDIRPAGDNTIVFGTPLYVAFHVPD